MRKVVVIEGVPMPNGLTILPCSLYVEEDRIPVTAGPDWSIENMIGWATDFERDGSTHEISFEIQWLDSITEEARDFYESDAFDPSLYCSNVKEKHGLRDNRIVFKARIRQISLIPISAYPVGHNPGANVDDMLNDA